MNHECNVGKNVIVASVVLKGNFLCNFPSKFLLEHTLDMMIYDYKNLISDDGFLL